ncbi:unnamed protein product [Phytophthora fragariaefolia]|uniref:Unnamed protein product n=1 Tax=Phytophthora fragariaefolia TaxID=1490495 RepID=A0A9W7DBW7_9STRA|nr:unnamed protein product [Phytophthora fragariaefolia]
MSMDFVFGLPRGAQGRTGILVFVDRFSKMLHLAPVAATITAAQSTAIFLDIVYRHHGLPTSIISDRDPRFTAAFWSELFKLVVTRLKMSTASHPETAGQIERANRVVEDVLRIFATSFKSWSSFLPMVEFALNNAVHASTGLTPFYVNYGRHPRVPALLGMERSMPQDDADTENDSAHLPNDPVASRTEAAGDPRRERADGTISSLVNGATTRHGARASTRGMRTRAATRAAPSDTASWASRMLINPRQRPRAIAYEDTSGAATSPAPPPANFDPVPAPQPRDTAAVSEFLQRRQSVVRYVRDAIAVAVDRQKENADRRGRKNMEKFAVGDRVLLSTTGIQPILVTNLGANKLAPRYIGPFKVLKVLGDAYTPQLPTALRLHPTFYVGRLRRYHTPLIPSEAATHQHPSLGPYAAVDAAAVGDAAPGSPDPPLQAGGRGGRDAERPQRPDSDRSPFERDGPAPLVDGGSNIRHIVETILQHDDVRAAPRMGRGVRHRDGAVPSHRQYLVRWLGPMSDSWEPRAGLLADVPDCVAAYEASLAQDSAPPSGAAARRA